MRSFLKSNQTLKTALLMPVTILPSSHERTEGGKEMGKGGGWGAGGSSCGPHVVRERTATGRQHSMERQQYLLGDHQGDQTYYFILMR